MWRLGLTLMVLVSACTSPGNDTNGGAHNAQPDVPDLEVRATLTAAQGGELELDDGAKVIVPAGVLARDGEVVLNRRCPEVLQATGLGQCQYVVASDVALLGRIDVLLPDGDADCVLAGTDDGWRCLADSTVESGDARATMSRFSALVTRDDSWGFDDDTCTDLQFAPCGGELTGSWELVRACGSRRQVTGSYSEGPDPYQSCGPDAVFRSYPYSVRGTLEFTEEIAERTAFAYSMSGGGEIFEHELVTEACLASVGESCNQICSSNSSVCTCVIEESSWNTAGGGYWEEIDGQVYLDGFTDPLRYCVSGDELVIERAHLDGAYHMVYERR